MTLKYGFRSLRCHFHSLRFCSKYKWIPSEPCAANSESSKMPPPPSLPTDLVNHLERQSLVRFSSEEAVAHLEKAIRFADELQAVDTEGVAPMVSPQDDLACPTRSDEVRERHPSPALLANAAATVEDYFVTPPTNVRLEEREAPSEKA